MKHKGTVKIETERLLLRRFLHSDAKESFYNWTNDEKVIKFLKWTKHKNVNETKDILSLWISKYSNENFYQWAIVLKKTKEVIGTISVIEVEEKAEKVNLGFCIGSKWWNLGYCSEALNAIIMFLFKSVKVKRIEARHDPNNFNSGKVMLKCGMMHEATLRKADWNNTGIVDICVYSILSSDYFK